MYKVIILPLAKQDIKEAATWYNNKQAGLGKRFTTDISQKVTLLKQNPLIAANRYQDIKTAVLDIFPFMMHYKVDKLEKLVIILAVLHTSRDPDIWSKR